MFRSSKAAEGVAKASSDNIAATIAAMAPKMRAAFLLVVERIRDDKTLRELAALLEAGNVEGALAAVETHAAVMGAAWSSGFAGSGAAMSEFLSARLGKTIVFDQVNHRAVRIMQESQVRLIREFTQGQRETTKQAITRGIVEGANPIAQARTFRHTVGLTQYQEGIIANYRIELGSTDPEVRRRALRRRLRDGRFDPTIARRIRGDKPLTKAQIDKAVARYRERWIKFRSEVIARTEALRSVHEGVEEALQQAVDDGHLDPAILQRKWVPASDSKVRHSHSDMRGQLRPLGVPFQSGNGNLLRYPGDPSAPASDVIQCRCVITTRIRAPRKT